MLCPRSLVPLAALVVVGLGLFLTEAASIGGQLSALRYLVQFGYVEGGGSSKGGGSSSLVSEDSLKTAVQEFQRFAGLEQTGELDNETVTTMALPRCGVKDKVGHGLEARRRKRYALQGSRWKVKELSYRVSKYPSERDLTKPAVDDEIQKAFKIWSDYTDLRFVHKTSGRVHIDVRFEKGEHGDGDPFDGRGGTLAHAYFPIYGGDAHFDDEERWTINSVRGTNLFQVAAHEFGHSLGLSHSDVRGSLMAPFYRGYESNFKMHQDDVKGIQSLYGKKSSETPSKTGGPGSPPIKPGGKPGVEDGELCADSKIDTIFVSAKRTFAFKGDLYWEVADEGLADGYPRSIAKDWDNLPANIDAAFTWSNGKTYFFKGTQYWRYTGRSKDNGYPKSISEGFRGLPDNLGAAFVWSGNDKIYFFKGGKYWKFDPDLNPPVGRDYPKSASNWERIPDGIDAAFQWTNGFTYFFKGTQYWRFNDRTFSVDSANPPFPRSSAFWWFGCKAMSAGNTNRGIPVESSLKEAQDQDRLEVDDASADVGLHQAPPTQGAYQQSNAAASSFSSRTTTALLPLLLLLPLLQHH